jgi:hypothetical protein
VTEAYRAHEPLPLLHRPVLVGMFTGWIDASGAAAAALAAVQASCRTRPLVTFDSDLFIDYRARRPTMELRDGVNTRLVWPDIELHVGSDDAGRHVLVLSGPEPDSNWRRFGEVVADLAVELGVAEALFLGAYPFATPHTRPSRLSCSTPSAELAATLSLLKNSVDVPAGVAAVLEHSLHARGIGAIGLWAQVPHYLGTMSYPAASAALLDGLAQRTGLVLDVSGLRQEATVQRERVDTLVAGNDEHRGMVLQLEAAYDAFEDQTTSLGDDAGGSLGSEPIPTADELAAEFEQFLRDQDG